MEESQNQQLNDFLCYYIQNQGIDYVVDNYIDLRNQYYYIKQTA